MVINDRIIAEVYPGTTRELPNVTFYADGLAVVQIVKFSNDESNNIVRDLQNGRSFPVKGDITAERVAIQIAKAFLFDADRVDQ